MKPSRFALLGAGFWARFQLAAWREVRGAECVAICDPRRDKADALARALAPQASVYDDVDELLEKERLDFMDVVSDVTSHRPLVERAAARGLAVICQKPLADSLPAAEAMVASCRAAKVPLLVHENFRWQAPARRVKEIIAEGRLGTPFRARIDFISGFPVFDNQPFLRTLDQFILTDVGTHILDLARFFFGEARTLYCRTQRMRQDIRGEDVATVVLGMAKEATVVCQMAYAGTPLEKEGFPETRVFIEGDKGSLELAPDHWVRLTTSDGTKAERVLPPVYPWADPAYALVHASIVPCLANLLSGLRGEGKAETTGEDNLETLRLVYGSYESARTGQVLRLSV